MDVRTSSAAVPTATMLTVSDGTSHQVYYCGSRIPYNTSDNTYTSEGGTTANT